MSSESAAKGPRRNVRIGKYEVLAHIATGGMGAVYKARDTENGNEVALKVLSPEMAAKPSMVERFRREAKHAAKLQHENVVTLHEFGEANRTCYLVMEFVNGVDLHEYIHRQGALDPNEALEIILQGCRALDHAYEQGLVHRDIKPSNFLLTQHEGRRVVKLTDLGLAREASNEEFRVTRAGTTVGTLDYMSPEQARDSGLADIRSDLYSLGGTWFHLLAGHAPFPKGGLGERLHRILHETAPDVRQFNPRVSEEMAAVLHRLLAKRPSQRYQTPAELLRDLEALQRGEPLLTPRQALEHLAQDEGEVVEPRKKSRRGGDGRRTPRSVPNRAGADTKSSKSTMEVPIAKEEESHPPYLWYGIVGAAAIVLAVALAIGLSLRRGHRDKALVETPNVTPTLQPIPVVPKTATPNPPPRQDKPPDKNDERTLVVSPPKKPNWPALYRRTEPFDAAALRKEIDAPWNTPAATGPTVEWIVGRFPSDPSGKTFASLAAACKAIPDGATGILELRDNGPFFDVSAAVAGRSVVIRAAKGYHPLLVWDVQRMLDERRRNRRTPAEQSDPPVFLNVKHGNLTLQDVHLAFQWPDVPSEGAAVLRVEDGDLDVRDCTFSVAGKPRDGITLAHFVSDKLQTARCRFTRCHARGGKMSVLDLRAPGANVLFDHCLLVGDDTPLLRVRASDAKATHLQAVRSTMICGKNLVELRPQAATDRDPAFDWLGWDALLTRKNPEVGGELLRLVGDFGSRQLKWRAVNCLYAGWGNLLAGSTSIAGTDLAAWQHLWNRREGDAAQADRWPAAVSPELAETPATAYRTANSPVAFAASTSSEELLGCDLDRLPPARDNWLALTFERYPLFAPAPPEDADAPEIPFANDGLFHGARVDLTQNPDLGLYLNNVQKTYRFAPEVVLHLSGNGDCLTTPFHCKGSNLVLYFEPPAEKMEPLVLVPAGRAAEALFDIEQGNLSVINGNLRFSNATEARVLPWLIKMRGGDLRLFRTHLLVPPRDSGIAFRGLISLVGSGDAAAERVRSCLLNESVLLSARDAIAVEGIGARVLLKQTLAIAGGDALHLKLDPDFSRQTNGPNFAGKANVQCLLERATLSAAGAVLHLSDVAQTGPPAEPVVLHSRDCGFVNLFGLTPRPSLIKYEGEALTHGLLLWQSENDAFDRRLWFAALRAAPPVPKNAQARSSWIALWGSPNMRQSKDITVLPPHHLEGDRWSLERLIGWKAPGANLDKLRLPDKAKTPR
jgi:serine/threonine protein kinase